MSRWAVVPVPVPLPLLLLRPLSLWVQSASLAVAKATSCRVHSAWSVQSQANGAPIPQPAQVLNLSLLKCSLQMEAGLHQKNLIICGNNIIFSSSCPTALICPLLEAPENGQINCSSSAPAYNSECSFSCDPEYVLHGHVLLICDRHGNWTGEKPNCQGKIDNTNSKASVILNF